MKRLNQLFIFCILTLVLSLSYSTLNAQYVGENVKANIIIDPANKKNVSGYAFICYATGVRIPQQNLDIKRGLINLKEAMLKWTKIDVRLDNPIMLSSPQLKKMPFIYIAFDKGLELTEPEKKNIREYLENGGFMVIENIGIPIETNPAESSFEKMFDDVITKGRFAPIRNDHPLYYSFFDFTSGPPRGAEINMVDIYDLEGVTIEGRLAAIYSKKRYVVKWNELSNNEPQLRMGVNMLVYALKQKGGIAHKE
ncbi:MAG: DUF4159 domain-containing protein [Candidatus Latescibacteria bacterium]|nr:DUF4159 domain-containing protein [Candidatus Latescibacterota bacterium]